MPLAYGYRSTRSKTPMKKLIAIACAAMAPCLAQAGTTLFADDFNGDTVTWNTVPAGWTVTAGTVDVVGPGWWGQLCAAGGGSCVDLDGSTSTGGTLVKSFNLTAGTTYKAYFDLAGNQRGGQETVDIGFGSASQALTLSSNAAWATYEISFTPGQTGSYSLSFHNRGGDDVGAVLDNVSIQAVPEPETYAMMIAGLGLLGAVARRRRA